MYYLFINEYQIEPYNGEILKRFVGSKMVKAISNPANEDLKEFGYMELVFAEMPEYDESTQYLEKSYHIQDGKIYERYETKQIVIEDDVVETEEEI